MLNFILPLLRAEKSCSSVEEIKENSIRNIDERCYSVLCLIDMHLDKQKTPTIKQELSQLISMGDRFVLVEKLNFGEARWKYGYAWIGKEPKIYMTYEDRTIYNEYLKIRKYIMRERGMYDEYISMGRGFIESRSKTESLGMMNYASMDVWRVPTCFGLCYDCHVGLNFDGKEVFVFDMRINEEVRPHLLSEFWNFDLELMNKVMNCENLMSDTIPRRTILLKHAQSIYQLSYKKIAQKRADFENDFKQDGFIVKNQNDCINGYNDPTVIFPLFLLFSLQDLKNDSNTSLSNIANIVESMVENEFSQSLREKMNETRQFWKNSFEESENFEIEHKSLLSIIRQQIKMRIVSDESIRMFLNSLCISCTFYQSESMFNQIVKLSNALYSWFKYAK